MRRLMLTLTVLAACASPVASASATRARRAGPSTSRTAPRCAKTPDRRERAVMAASRTGVRVLAIR